MTLLSDTAILRHLEYGSIVIEPFRRERLNTDSYDLELGPFFWRYIPLASREPHKLERGEGFRFVDARPEGGLWLAPGERVLGHSVEIAGGKVADFVVKRAQDLYQHHVMTGGTAKKAVTSALRATSTAGRHGLTVCECAGWGDVGFVNIWTYEITNNLVDRVWLPVGALIAQIHFDEVEVPTQEYADKGGHTYVLDTLEPKEIRESWTPENMLPKPLKVREGWKDVPWKTK